MVKTLAAEEQDAIAQALRAAEAQTSAALATVIVPVSDTYLTYALVDGFLAASLTDIALWFSHIVTDVAWLLVIQLAVMALALLPAYRRCMARFLPRHIRHHHAAKSAVLAFHHLLHQTPPEKPVVMLYVALTERYVHILHSRALNDTIDKAVWQEIVDRFTATMKAADIKTACLGAVINITDALVD
jgi:uncharacterized membrane protein